MRRNLDFYRSAELYDPVSGKFQATGEMTIPRVGHAAVLLHSGKVLIVGGWIGHGETDSAELYGDTVTASAEIFDPVTKKFAVTGSMLTVRYKHSAGLLPDGRVLIAGGSDDRGWSGKMNSAEIYDPAKQTFTAASPLHDSRFKLPPEAVQLAFGQLLFAGGSKAVEVYDPARYKFLIAAGQIDAARHFMTATKLEDGSVLLAGGYPDHDWATNETWIYHP
jgi:hypothetical protein